MIFYLDFYVNDQNDDALYIECTVDCSGQAPDYSSWESDWDYYGYFEIEDVQYTKILDWEDNAVKYEDVPEEIRSKIHDKVQELAYNLYTDSDTDQD